MVTLLFFLLVIYLFNITQKETEHICKFTKEVTHKFEGQEQITLLHCEDKDCHNWIDPEVEEQLKQNL